MFYIISRFKNQGGAAIASNRLYSIFKKNNYPTNYIYLSDGNSIQKFYRKIIFELEYRLNLLVLKQNLRSINVIRLLNIKKYDHKDSIINIHWFHFNLLSLKSISKIKSPLILTLHDSWFLNKTNSHYDHKYEGNNILLRKYIEIIDNYTYIRKKKIKNIDKVVVPSNWLLNKATQSKLFDKDKIVLIPNPLDTEKFRPTNLNTHEPTILIYFKNQEDFFKGGDLVINFLKKLSSRYIDSNLKINLVGNNQNVFFENLNISNLGFIDEKTLITEYQKSTLCLNFSRSENLSQFLTQACSCGIPCIGFDIGGNSDIIKDNRNGHLIPPYNLDLFIDKTLLLISNKEKLNQFSNFSRKLAITEWNENLVFEKYLKIINEVS